MAVGYVRVVKFIRMYEHKMFMFITFLYVVCTCWKHACIRLSGNRFLCHKKHIY